MGLSVRMSGGSGVSMAAATAVLRGCVHGFSCGEPTDDAADAIRASNTAEFAEFGTGDYRDDHSMEASTSDVLVRRRREGLQESRAAKQ